MKLVIIESPYGQNPELFTKYLALCIQDTLARGEAAYASVPIYALTRALDDLKPEERATGIAAGLEWYSVAEGCVAYVDHGISAGMREGITAARSLNVPVVYRRIFPQPETT